MARYARYKTRIIYIILLVALFAVVLTAIGGCALPPYEPDADYESESNYSRGDTAEAEPPGSGAEDLGSLNPDLSEGAIPYEPQLPELRSVIYSDSFASSGSPPITQTAEQGNRVVISENTGNLARSGFLFYGWRACGGFGAVLMPGDLVVLNEDLTLHPVWKNITFSVSYFGNGATSGRIPARHLFMAGESVLISANAGHLAREGYVFSGWQLAGSHRVFRENTFVNLPAENIRLLAFWMPIAATVLPEDYDENDDIITEPDVPPDSATLDNIVDAWITAGMDFFRDITDRFDSNRAFIEDNYAHNRTFDFDGFIFDQRAYDARNLRFGSGAMWRADVQFGPGEGWGWYNGCGWVATYNAALLLGRNYHPAYIIRYFETLGGAVADGMFGLNPMAIDTFFQNRGVTAVTHNLPDSTDDIIRDSSVSVLTYIRSDGGAHIVTIYYDIATEMFRVFNDWIAGSTRTAPGELRSVDAWLRSADNNIWQTLTVTTLW